MTVNLAADRRVRVTKRGAAHAGQAFGPGGVLLAGDGIDGHLFRLPKRAGQVWKTLENRQSLLW
jgi:hypothetical protein